MTGSKATKIEYASEGPPPDAKYFYVVERDLTIPDDSRDLLLTSMRP